VCVCARACVCEYVCVFVFFFFFSSGTLIIYPHADAAAAAALRTNVKQVPTRNIVFIIIVLSCNNIHITCTGAHVPFPLRPSSWRTDSVTPFLTCVCARA
jgi:hypothetical protein